MRIVRVQASDFWILLTMTRDEEFHYKCIKGLPKTAKFVRMHQENHFDFTLIYEDESFELIELGQPIPVLRVEFYQLPCAYNKTEE